MKVEGACHCGFVTFAAEVDPETAGICHCSDCQTISGSAFRTTVRSLPGKFEIKTGSPTIYIKKTAESGNPREHAFCPRCGTSIYATTVSGDARPYSVRLGTLRPRGAITPKRQIWMRSRAAWLDVLDELAPVDKQG
ncbi:MAG TPA: GFA family protein [Polyangiaceae bacterium]